MTLSKVERWILWNQYKILEHVDPSGADYYRKMQDVLESGYELEYDWNTQFLIDSDGLMTREKCQFVINTMAMYDAIQRSYANLQDKSAVEQHTVEFLGFDGNNETEYMGYARFLVEKESKFTYLRVGGDSLNSHMPTLAMYSRMLEVWKGPLAERYDLTEAELTQLLAARRHT